MVAKQRKPRRMYHCIFFLLTVVIVFGIIWKQKILPPLSAAAEHLATAAAEQAFADSVKDILPSMETEELLQVRYDKDGEICLVETDSVAVNRIRFGISESLRQKLGNLSVQEAGIPLGSLLGNGFFYGWGPSIHARLLASGSHTISLSSDFTEAGVNQTHWRLVMKVETEVTVLFLSEKKTVNVPGEYVIAELLIAGEVPESWTRLDSESNWPFLSEESADT